jgi:hypothetical protein
MENKLYNNFIYYLGIFLNNFINKNCFIRSETRIGRSDGGYKENC